MNFKASYDTLTKIVSILVALILAGGACAMPGIYQQDHLIFILWGILVALIFVFAYGFSVTLYSVTPVAIVIHRPLGNKQIQRADINTVQAINAADLRGSWRTFGSGGLFGYYGKFCNRKFGSMTWYMTRRDRPVLITLNNDKKIVISPDDTEGFRLALKECGNAGNVEM